MPLRRDPTLQIISALEDVISVIFILNSAMSVQLWAGFSVSSDNSSTTTSVVSVRCQTVKFQPPQKLPPSQLSSSKSLRLSEQPPDWWWTFLLKSVTAQFNKHFLWVIWSLLLSFRHTVAVAELIYHFKGTGYMYIYGNTWILLWINGIEDKAI